MLEVNVHMVLNIHRNHKAYGRGEGEGGEWILYDGALWVMLKTGTSPTFQSVRSVGLLDSSRSVTLSKVGYIMASPQLPIPPSRPPPPPPTIPLIHPTGNVVTGLFFQSVTQAGEERRVGGAE